MSLHHLTPREFELILLSKLKYWYDKEHPCAQGYQQKDTEWKDGRMFVRIQCCQCLHIESAAWRPMEVP